MSISAPLYLHQETVREEWIDYNGHMNLAYYVLIFDHATDNFLDYIGLDAEFRQTHNCSTFAAEMHVNYLQEAGADQKVKVSTQLLSYDEKRIHYFHRMHDVTTDELLATNELLSLYMDMKQRKVGRMPLVILDKLEQVELAHAELEPASQVGNVIGIRKSKKV